MGEKLCVVCRHRTPERGHVCDKDRERITEQLSDLPRKLRVLPLQLVPGSNPPRSERVAQSRTGTPVGARIDALNFTGPGSARVIAASMLHPKIRKWRTVHTVTVTVVERGKARQEERQITTWEQELVVDADGNPVQAMYDDQADLLPPGEWLALWARTWREHFGLHTRPAPGRGPKTASAARAALDLISRDKDAIDTLLGIRDPLPAHQRPHDPLAEEWRLRFGDSRAGNAMLADSTMLLTWLDNACDEDVDIAAFAAELRALTAELTRILGEHPDQEWLGRCPTKLTDKHGQTNLCGFGLWQDPYVSRVACARCRTTWSMAELLHLAIAIRREWPLDRRRRYTRQEIQGLDQTGMARQLHCPTCAATAKLTWRDSTTGLDRETFWRPNRPTCPNGCPDAERLI